MDVLRQSAVSAGVLAILTALVWDPALRQGFFTSIPLYVFLLIILLSPLIAGVVWGISLCRDFMKDTSARNRQMCEDFRW
jgi:hypothetical protein